MDKRQVPDKVRRILDLRRSGVTTRQPLKSRPSRAQAKQALARSLRD